MTAHEAKLTENDVVGAVRDHLERAGWIVDQALHTTQHGTDIVARGPGQIILRIEAKGATSSKNGTPRHDLGFSRAQIGSHVARAFYTATAALDGQGAGSDERTAMALPATPDHREFIDRIQRAISRLGVGVFWVHASDRVHLDADWQLAQPDPLFR